MSNPPYGEQPGGYPSGQPGGQGYPGGQPGGYPDGQPSSKYGTDPYAPGTYGGPMAEPKKFSLLKTFTLVSLAAYVLSSLPSFFVSGDQVRQDMIATYEQSGMSSQEAADMSEMGMALNTGFTWVTLIIAVGLYLLVYFGLKKNKNWARVTGIVFGLVGAVFSLLGIAFGSLLGMGVDALGIVLTLLYVAVTVYWLMLAFSTDVKTYLKQFTR